MPGHTESLSNFIFQSRIFIDVCKALSERKDELALVLESDGNRQSSRQRQERGWASGGRHWKPRRAGQGTGRVGCEHKERKPTGYKRGVLEEGRV